ncbi:MAG: hypothetical protein AB8G86_10715 [Saprospiraceae bacterium]
MTLKDFFELLSVNPAYIIGFFLLIPLAAFIGTVIGKGEEDETVWQIYYSTLIYLVAVPGIFSVTLNIYLFLFERRSVMDADVFTQILPIFSMFATLMIIRKSINLDKIPGFGKLSGLIWMVGAVLLIMWFMEKTRIYVFSYMPVQYVLFILIGLIVVFRMGWGRLSKP